MKTAVLLLALAAPLAPRGDAVSLTPRPEEGAVFQERERFWSAQAGAAQDDAVNRPSFSWSEAVARAREDDGSVTARESFQEDELLEVREGTRVRVRRTYVTSAATRVDPEAAEPGPRTASAPFEGQTIVLVADGGETRLVGEIDGEEVLAPADLDLAPRWERALPPGPVEVGDSWTLPAEVAARLLEPLSAAKASASGKLARLEAGDSGPVACLQLDLHGSGAGAPGGTAEIEASGLLRWDVDGGHLIEVTLSGAVHATDREGQESTLRFGLRHDTRRTE